MVERRAADERGGRESLRLEQCRGRRPRRRESIARVVADAVLVRIAARENRRVRDERDDGVRVGEVEAGAARGQLVQVGGRCAAAARAECVGAPCIDRHEQHIAVGVDVEREGRSPEPPPHAERDDRRACDQEEDGFRTPVRGQRYGGGGAGGLLRALRVLAIGGTIPTSMQAFARRPRMLALPLAALAAVVAAAQQPPQQRPTFRTTVDLVEVDVVAVDQNGQPVHGLAPEEFTLFDRKKPQTIAAFQEVTHEHDVDPAPLDAAPSAPPPKHDVASNRTAQSDRLVVIVVDDLHIFKGRTDTARQIARAVVRDLGPQASMGILFTSGDHNIEVTEDRTELLAAIDKMAGRRPYPRPILAVDNLHGKGPEPTQDIKEFYDDMNAYKTLQDAARMLGADDLRRKAFVLVSEGIGKI